MMMNIPSDTQPKMRVDLHQARAMLNAMGYECEGLGLVADIPASAMDALQQVWSNASRGNLRLREVESVLSRLYIAMLEGSRRHAADQGTAIPPVMLERARTGTQAG